MARRYDENEIRRGLLLVVLHGGTTVEPAKLLKQEGIAATDRTLRNWKRQHRELYNELRDEHGGEQDKEAIRRFRDLVLLGTVAQREAFTVFMEQLKDGKVKDPSAAIKNLAIATGINTDKALVMQGRPTLIIDNPAAIEDRVNALLNSQGYDAIGTAEDITDAVPVAELAGGSE